MSSSTKSSKVIGFIGLGAIGLPIASNLIQAGFTLKVFSRKKSLELESGLKGATLCASPIEVATGSDFLLLCVSDENAVEMILFGPEGIENSLSKGTYVIDFSTISPSKAKLIAKKLAKKKVTYIDAPVSGGTEGAKAGTLTIFLGGNTKDLKKVSIILNSIAKNIYSFGQVGKGQEVKAINQILVAGSYAALAEAISLGQSLSLPMDLVVEALTKGAANSWALENRSKAMIEDSYPLGFKLKLHHKDLCIALQTAQELGIKLPITMQVKELEEELIGKGYQDEDLSVLRRSIKSIR